MTFATVGVFPCAPVCICAHELVCVSHLCRHAYGHCLSRWRLHVRLEIWVGIAVRGGACTRERVHFDHSPAALWSHCCIHLQDLIVRPKECEVEQDITQIPRQCCETTGTGMCVRRQVHRNAGKGVD